MRTVIIFHEVGDIDRWLESPRRREIFGPLGITTRTFVEPGRSNRVGLIVEAPSMELLEEALASPMAAEAMQHDGVRADTIVVLTER